MQKGILFIVIGVVLAAAAAFLLAGCGGRAPDKPVSSGAEGARRSATLTFSSFDGGGYEYTARTDDPSVAAVTIEREYNDPHHAEIDGAAYDVVITIEGLRPGTTELRVVGESPIMDREEHLYAVTVDEDLRVTVTQQEQPQSDAIRPVPTLVIETQERLFYASLCDNEAAKALTDNLSAEPISLELEDNGGFEKVGALPWTLPQADEEITASPGDVLLYEGDRLCLYYDENTYAFTPLAKIDGATREELLSALGEGSVSVLMYIEWSE